MYTILSGAPVEVKDNLNDLEKVDPKHEVMSVTERGGGICVLVKHEKPFEPVNYRKRAAQLREDKRVEAETAKLKAEKEEAQRRLKEAEKKLSL